MVRRTRKLGVLCGLILWMAGVARADDLVRPDIVLVTVDTLRYDRLSFNGYQRPTSPNIDALFEDSVRFGQARVAEPLTAPSMVSMITSRHPHHHAASRNGLRMRPEMLSIGKVLARRGYVTVAFVGNWTLRHKLSGLGEHFDEYHEVFNRKRYFGLFKGEATAEDLTDQALERTADLAAAKKRRPFFLWVHYVEPHGPYRLQKDFVDRLGIPEKASASDRYDTEVAFVDQEIGRLLTNLEKSEGPEGTLYIFSSDHGESLGEHNYWGHGRHVFDVTLRVPLSFAWRHHLEPGTIDTMASNLDIAPTVLGLLGLPSPEIFEGHDYSAVLRGMIEPPRDRVTFHQAHKGVSMGRPSEPRQKGLLEVARVGAAKKEMLSLKGEGSRQIFDLLADPYETTAESDGQPEASTALAAWLETVRQGLVEADLLPTTALDRESLEKLQALGYVE